MRTLLRQRQSGLYFQQPGSWTVEEEAARDFRSVSRAIELVETEGYRDLEVVFWFEEPRRMSSVPVEELTAWGAERDALKVIEKEEDHEHSKPEGGKCQ